MILPLEYQTNDPRSGRSVSVPFGPYRHFGTLFVIDGELLVFANSDAVGQARLETWDEFADGKQARFEPGYESTLDWREKYRRACSVAHNPYDVASWNCEHFVNYLQGLPAISRQARATVALVFVGVVAALALSKAA